MVSITKPNNTEKKMIGNISPSVNRLKYISLDDVN
jgi:hypothetical protein